ncbi:hypothetical protein DIPPA_29417 [Diplonema papillatum]|nr:hypothetical protein DIPPA_29417 [Diplonema papillatum]
MSTFLKELLQGDDSTKAVFDEYLALLGEASISVNGEADFAVTAVSAASVPSLGECVALADSRGFIRFICLKDATFRLFTLVDQSYYPGDVELVGTELLNCTLHATQHAYIDAMCFHAGEHCLFYTTVYSNQVYHTGWVDEPTSQDYEVYLFGRHAGNVTALHSRQQFVVTGDSRGNVSIWDADDRLQGTEATPLNVLENLHKAAVTRVALVEEESKVITASSDSSVNIIDTASAAVVRRLMIESGSVTCIGALVAAGGKRCFSIGTDRGALMVFDLDGALVHLLPAMASQAGEAVSTVSVCDRREGVGLLEGLFAVGTNLGAVTILSQDTFHPVSVYQTSSALAFLHVAALDSTDAVVAIATNGSVWIWPASRVLSQSQPPLPSSPIAKPNARASSPEAHDSDARYTRNHQPTLVTVPPHPQRLKDNTSGSAPTEGAVPTNNTSLAVSDDEDLGFDATRPVEPRDEPRLASQEDELAAISRRVRFGGNSGRTTPPSPHRVHEQRGSSTPSPRSNHSAAPGDPVEDSFEQVERLTRENAPVVLHVASTAGGMHLQSRGSGLTFDAARETARINDQRRAAGLLLSKNPVKMKNPAMADTLASGVVAHGVSATPQDACREAAAAVSTPSYSASPSDADARRRVIFDEDTELFAAEHLSAPRSRHAEPSPRCPFAPADEASRKHATAASVASSRGESVRATALSNQIEEIDAATFDAGAYKVKHPQDYTRARDLHPATDVTSHARHERRYTNLPALQVRDDEEQLAPGFLTKSVRKQLDKKWVASLSAKPEMDALFDVGLQPRWLASSWVGEIYDCPSSLEADGPLLPSAELTVQPYLPAPPMV